MLNKFEKKVADFIESEGLFGGGGNILLGVSGGADSIALLYVMLALREEKLLREELHCAHINHQLRGDAGDMDEAFVVEQCGKLGVSVTAKRVDVKSYAVENKLSVETAGRELRIESLMDIAKRNGCRRIALGHHKNDNAETILHRLSRGTGFRGISGIWPMREFGGEICFSRPLLSVSREEIVAYLKQKKVVWRRDKTNEDCRYRRNFIRHRLMGELQSVSSGSVVEQLSRLANSGRRFYKLVCERADKVFRRRGGEFGNKGIRVSLSELSIQHPAVKVELIRRVLVGIGCGERDLTSEQYERILQLSETNVGGRKIELAGGFIVRREYEGLVFEHRKDACGEDEGIAEGVEIEIGGQMRFGGYLIEAEIFDGDSSGLEKFKAEKTSFVEWFDAEKLKLPLKVSRRREGDRFVPLGMTDEKKVGRFLTDERVLQRIRKKILIVSDKEKIVWVWPIRISEEVKVTKQTRRILRLEIRQ